MTDLQHHERALQENGFCLIEQVIPPEACRSLCDRLLAITRSHREQQPAAMKVSFVPGVINHDQSFAPYLADERVLALATSYFGPHVRISFTSAIINDSGKKRTDWHADWPFNQNSAGHVPAPYPDRTMHLTAIIMVSSFSLENGGTLVVPASHRFDSNPSDPNLDIDPYQPYPTEQRITGSPGTMLLFDSRLWHAAPSNPSEEPRVALVARYAPWWLNLQVLDPGSDLHRQMVTEPERTNSIVPRVKQSAYDALPGHVQPLFRHWVEQEGP